MAGNRYVPTIFTATDSNGDPIPGAKLYFYENATTTPKNTWSDIDLTDTNAWPVVADGAGRFTTDIFLDTDPYRVKLTDENGVQIWLKDDCNTFNGPASAGLFPFPGAVVEFYGNQTQLNVALAAFWYVMDGNNGLPNLDDLFVKSCIDVGSIGTTGGTTIPTGTVDPHILTVAELPAHTHTTTLYNSGGVTGTTNFAAAAGNTTGATQTSTSNSSGGSGAAHDHTLTMDTYNPPFYQLIKLVYLGY